MHAALLPDRSILRVSGEDARHFLQNLVTSDIEPLKSGEARFAALLTPQGKILFDFFIVAEQDGGFLLDVSAKLAADLTKRLGFYKLRAKVEIEARPDLAVAVVFDESPAKSVGLAYSDPRHPKLGIRMILPASGAEDALREAGFSLADAGAWQTHRIALGIPEGGKDFPYGDTFPHEADMDQLKGVDFSKGCFIGQEVVSRMQHKSVTRTRVVPVSYDGAAPAEGADVKIGEKAAGIFGSSADGRGFAKLRLDRVEDGMKANETLSAGNIQLRLVKPDWAKFPFPGDAS
jgi:folate-binding protein YgfZ